MVVPVLGIDRALRPHRVNHPLLPHVLLDHVGAALPRVLHLAQRRPLGRRVANVDLVVDEVFAHLL